LFVFDHNNQLIQIYCWKKKQKQWEKKKNLPRYFKV